jgi:hypothetical protein
MARRSETMEWYHVSPLFLLPRILASGGLRCGADLAGRSPRRESSQDEDDKVVAELQERRPSDFVLLFRNKSSALLDEKLRGTRKPGRAWNAYPHVRFVFSAQECLKLAGGQVHGSLDNVGRTLKRGGRPRVALYRNVSDIQAAKVEEILIPASSLEAHQRRLPWKALRRIVMFSDSDHVLVAEHFSRVGQSWPTALEEKVKYAASQRDGPGKQHLNLTQEYYKAIWEGDCDREERLSCQLAMMCFD